MSRGRQKGERLFIQPGMRAHAAKFNVDTAARKRLRVALKTLDEHLASVRMALEVAPPSVAPDIASPAYVIARTLLALNTLVYGEQGQFR